MQGAGSVQGPPRTRPHQTVLPGLASRPGRSLYSAERPGLEAIYIAGQAGLESGKGLERV